MNLGKVDLLNSSHNINPISMATSITSLNSRSNNHHHLNTIINFNSSSSNLTSLKVWCLACSMLINNKSSSQCPCVTRDTSFSGWITILTTVTLSIAMAVIGILQLLTGSTIATSVSKTYARSVDKREWRGFPLIGDSSNIVNQRGLYALLGEDIEISI